MATIKREHSFGEQGVETHTTTYRCWRELIFIALVLLAAVMLLIAGQRPDIQVDVHGTAVPSAPATQLQAQPTAELYAALAVYEQATADDWLQRTAIANAALNDYADGGVTTASPLEWVAPPVGFDPLRWEQSLAAVEAVASGDYALPEACVRATRVIAQSDARGLGAQCVVRDLVFVEAQQ